MGASSDSAPPQSVSGKILVVENNKTSRQILRRLLTQQGHSVDIARDGEEALQKVSDRIYDILLLDIIMPNIDGFAVLETIKADSRYSHLPVIMISAMDDINGVIRCIKHGAEDFLPKPVNPTLLKARIDTCLEKKRLRDREKEMANKLAETEKMLSRELQERLKEQAQAMALHDALTGLPNRMLMEDRFEQEVQHCERNRTKMVAAFIDLDHFKQINDLQGHEVGDRVLVAFANRLRETVRDGDTVARWGGDEMILLLPGVGEKDARKVCERLKRDVQRKIAKEDGFDVTLSMGAAVYPSDARHPEELLQSADAALLLAKKRDRNQVIVFGECEELKSFRQQASIRALLTKAVSEDGIEVHFQPIIDAGTGRAVGVEALARWHEEGHGWLPPSMFIPLAESMGLIDDLSRRVHEQALRHMSLCHREGFPLTLSLNISLRQLLRADFSKDYVEMTRSFGIEPSQVILEMTESQAMLGLTSEVNRLEELSAAGFRLSIDDFGQGYSSLANLHEMPVEEIKIDRKFIENVHTEKGRRIVQTILELSRILKLETVAEGIESGEQAAILKELGAHRLQGFHFAKPLPDDEFLTFLQNQKTSSALASTQ